MEQHLTSGLPQDKPPPRRSVAELVGRFKGSAAPSDAAEKETEKPVRRRPPRSLLIPKAQADEQEPAGFTSPVPKAKRNSALIEKLQANLALSPPAMLPSPKSPGFRLVAPSFSPLSSGSSPSIPLSTVTPNSPVTEEEGPVSFEDPLTSAEGSVLSNINKGRVRHSLRRRPPSRRHRKSSSGDEVSVPSDAKDSTLASLTEPRHEGGGKEGGGEVFKKEEETAEVEDKTEEDQTKWKPKGDEMEEEKESKGGKESSSASGRREEEESSSASGRREEEESSSSSSGRREEEESSSSSSGRREEEESSSSSSGRREEEESSSSTSGRREEEESSSTSGRQKEECAERQNGGATTTEDKKETSLTQ